MVTHTGRQTLASRYVNWLQDRPLLAEVGFGSLAILFGVQTLKVFVPGMFWVLGDRVGISSICLGLIGLAVFLTAFAVIPLEKLLGRWRLVIIVAAGLALARLYVQIWWGEPLFNLSLAGMGVALFFIFLLTWYKDVSHISYFVFGLFGGLILDTAINGIFATYDPIWQPKLLPVLLTLVLIALQFSLLFGIRVESKAAATGYMHSQDEKGVTRSPFRPYLLLAIGPFLFLELVVLKNIPRLAAVTDWQLPAAFALVLVAQLGGLVLIVWLLTKVRRLSWLWGLGIGVVLVLSLIVAQQKIYLLPAVLIPLAQALISVLIAIIVVKSFAQDSRVSIGGAIGIVLLLLLLFAYYAVYDMKLPYNNTVLEPTAAAIVGLCAVGALLRADWQREANQKLWLVPAFAVVLMLLPIANFLVWEQPKPIQGNGYPVRVMTYNLHNGFNVKGHLNLEEIASVIEDNNADIVALQEVSRGWVISGGVDMIAWLSQRLKMPYIFGPTADPCWGNAILSRYPIVAFSRHDLPPRDLTIKRGFVVALVDIGNDDTVKVIATHFHHLEGGTAIRQLQVQTILNFWSDLGETVIMGDLNGEPNSSEIAALRRAGLVDVAKVMYTTPPFTYSSDSPVRRIDYIWISGDLQVLDASVPFSRASDHLPVIATINKQR